MIRAILHHALSRFGRRYDYDTGYMAEMVRADMSGVLRLGGVAQFSGYRFGLPPGPYFTAKFVATRAADCGACLRLVAAMASEHGVRLESLVAAAAGDGAADPDLRLAARFARAVLDRADDLSGLAVEAERRWGARGRMGLAAAVATGQFFPLLKRGLGHAQGCEMLPQAFRDVA